MKHEYLDGRCVRCGQTPCVDPEQYQLFDRLFGRTRDCLTDEQLAEMALYYEAIKSMTEYV